MLSDKFIRSIEDNVENIVNEIEKSENTDLLYQLFEEKLFRELAIILIYSYKSNQKNCMEWFNESSESHKRLFYQIILSKSIHTLKWFKHINFIIKKSSIKTIVKYGDGDLLDEIVRWLKLPSDFSLYIVRANRCNLLEWLSKKPKVSYKISSSTIVEAAKINNQKIFGWLMNNNYVWRKTFDELLKLNKFYYLLLLFENGYRGKEEINKLIEEETPEYLAGIRKYKDSIRYPQPAIDAVKNNDTELITNFMKIKSMVVYREIIKTMKMENIILYFNLSGQCKYFYSEILKTKDFNFNLFLQNINIHRDLFDLKK